MQNILSDEQLKSFVDEMPTFFRFVQKLLNCNNKAIAEVVQNDFTYRYDWQHFKKDVSECLRLNNMDPSYTDITKLRSAVGKSVNFLKDVEKFLNFVLKLVRVFIE